MKKFIALSMFVILATLLAASPVLATPGKGAIKGNVIDVDPTTGTIQIETKRGETVQVIVPREMNSITIAVEDWVLVKGTVEQDGIIKADWIKQVGKGGIKGDNEDKAEGKKDNSAFCADDKQKKLHPLAEKISEHYVVGKDLVMGYFCDGYGMGAIMLALKTSELESSDPGELLKYRAKGKGWGQIWKEMGLIVSEKEGYSPPGHLKRPDHAGPKVKDE